MEQKHIGDIVLGPRQIYLFDSEKELQDEQRQFMAFKQHHFELHGQLELGDFVAAAVDSLGWSEFCIYQHIFWLAHELKIHFKADGRTIPPHTAKHMLTESPISQLQLADNKPVDKDVFSRAKEIFSAYPENSIVCDYLDQAELARCLVHQIRTWKHLLDKCMSFAQRPGFPGKQEVENACAVVGLISDKLDPFSLIHAYCDHAEKISFLVQTIGTLTRFYDHHAEQWQMLVQFTQASRQTMTDIAENPELAAAYERFCRIMSLAAPYDQPYDQMDEALGLYKTLKPYHLEVLSQQAHQHRMTALKQVEALIRKMKSHLLEHDASVDLRNQSLFPLQRERKLIKSADSITAMDRSLQAAEEAFETYWEEVVDQSASV